ncbi:MULTISPECIES: HalX domain-containing protein [Haloprofundus]|uniref:HalX domain-containing protein n=1 Tax=Haloprofundus TaxID=1911573 RepID=UPI000E4510C8|nr:MULTISPECIES: HalX domain-containing protein [Haloprofundus]QCJ47974.1 response regulator [Haloprofundus sp. MHR1]
MTDEPPLVLVVEDEADLADLYVAWLDDEYRVRTAYGGHEALSELDDDVDVVLLDRRMPGLSGDEVLDAVRDRGIDCRVAMVTAVEPDFDIVEMGFDDYLVKPVTRESLLGTVSDLLLRSEYDDGVRELFALASKKAVLEAEKDESTLAETPEYRQLDARLSEVRSNLDERLQGVDHDSFVGMYRDIDREDSFGFDEFDE